MGLMDELQFPPPQATQASHEPVAKRSQEPLLEEENAALRAEIERQRAEIERQQAEIEQQRERIAELEKLLAEARRARKRQAAPFARGKKKDPAKKPGRQHGHPGSYRECPEQVERTLEAPALIGCDCCGGKLSELKRHENYQTDLPPVVPVLTRFLFESGWCESCQRRVFSRHEEQTSFATGAASAHLGPRVLALVADWKGRLGLPLRKIAEMLQTQFGLKVSAGALALAIARLARRAEPTLEAMKQALAQEDVVHADETGWRVAARPAWLWVICNDRFTIYTITANRRASIVAEILGKDFSGLLMRDGWRSYDARLEYSMLRCLVHLKRNAEDLEDTQQGGAAEAMGLFVLWLDGIFALRQSACELDALSYEREASELIEWFEEFLEQPQSSPSNQRFAARLGEIRDQVLCIIEDPALPATNNLAERQIRPAVIHRKISAGNKTEHGAEVLAILASLTTSCRQQGQSFLAWVHRLLTAPVGQCVPFWLPDSAPS